MYGLSFQSSLSASTTSMGEGIWCGSIAALRPCGKSQVGRGRANTVRSMPLYEVPAVCGGCGIGARALCAYMDEREWMKQRVDERKAESEPAGAFRP